MRRYPLLALPAVLAAGLLLTLPGCSRPWDTARTVVAATASGVAAADVALVDAYEASDCEGQEDVELLRVCVTQLGEQVEAVRIARDSVLVGESLCDAWEHGGTEPRAWRGWLETAGQTLARLIALLASAGVDVPEELAHWAAVLDAYIEGGGR